MVASWLARVVVVLALLGVFAFDGISVATAHFNASDDAQSAAAAAATAYKNSATADAAVTAAQDALPQGETLVAGSLKIANDGSVSLKVRKVAKSVLLHLWGPTKGWAVVVESGNAAAPS